MATAAAVFADAPGTRRGKAPDYRCAIDRYLDTASKKDRDLVLSALQDREQWPLKAVVEGFHKLGVRSVTIGQVRYYRENRLWERR